MPGFRAGPYDPSRQAAAVTIDDGRRGRYSLQRCTRAGEEDLRFDDELFDLLVERDKLRATHDHRRVAFRVVDTDDAEKGEAEWCEECGGRPTFAYACESCE